jgi:TatD DNase family protein
MNKIKKNYTFLIDTHCHLDFVDYENDLENVVKNAFKNNVKYIITISTNLSNFDKIKNIIHKYKNIYGTVGTHPLYVDDESIPYKIDNIIEKCKDNKIAAIGECGLDYSKMKSDNKLIQEKIFRAQIEASNISNLPFVIHNRDSDEDMERILLDEAKKYKLNGVFHCFSSSERLAEVAIEIGLNISFTGIITFKNANSLRDIVLKIPNDRIFVETDSPFLAPTPYRGKRNEPSYVVEIAKCLANIKGLTYDEVLNHTTQNALNFFNKIKIED